MIMAISPDLFMAILAMDSYNRGYDPGLVLPASATSQIGNALLAANSSVLGLGSDGQPIDEAASFFAQAHTLSSIPTVISYRGTDVLPFSTDPFCDPSPCNDGAEALR
jgi:hypothetical protein